jgi:hypothetical protein
MVDLLEFNELSAQGGPELIKLCDVRHDAALEKSLHAFTGKVRNTVKTPRKSIRNVTYIEILPM